MIESKETIWCEVKMVGFKIYDKLYNYNIQQRIRLSYKNPDTKCIYNNAEGVKYKAHYRIKEQ